MSGPTLQSWHHSWAEELVEDVVAPLGCLLVGNARLLQNVGLYVTAGQLAQRVEVDFDGRTFKVPFLIYFRKFY